MPEKQHDRQLDRLVDLLVEHATVVVSGAKIAAELGVPHSTLGEWMDRLRALGVEVQGFPGSGYQLVRLPDIPTPQAVRQQLAGSIFSKHVHHSYAIDSTMNAAARLAQRGAPEGTLVIAEEQTAGRGRFGRHWHSEAGTGLYFTFLLRPPIQPAQAPVLTLLAGVAVAEAIQESSQIAVDLRWPNDVLMNGKKCAGILVEMSAEPLRVSHILVGVGINVNHVAIPSELSDEATSLLREGGHRISRLELLISALKRVEHYYNRFLRQGAAGVIERFEEISSYVRGKPVRVSEGANTVSGITEGLTPEGILLLRREDGKLEKILSGLVRPA
jgi:BirA family transcriptional regulator, biotin operon repressor / biotin---[acetyl-CoA-carboxylase] ligase